MNSFQFWSKDNYIAHLYAFRRISLGQAATLAVLESGSRRNEVQMMRPRFLIHTSLAVSLALAFLFWRWPPRRPAASAPSRKIAQPTNVISGSIHPASQINPSVSLVIVPSPPGHSVTIYSNKLQSPAGFHEYVESHNIPVEFYGQTIDQDSNALAGVNFVVAIRHWTLPDSALLEVGTTEIRLGRTSGSDGRFEISGATGDSFDLESITKAGYEAEPGQRSFGPIGGSFENPVVFKMWSTNIHEQLIGGEKKFQIEPDGRPYFIDLTTGGISESGPGDLEVWIKRPSGITTGKKFDWSGKIEAISGGLLQQPAGDSSMYQAPADGYGPSFSFDQKVGSGWGDSTGALPFYVMLKGGQEYGRITIELVAYYNNKIPGLIRLSYAINPSGSRILR